MAKIPPITVEVDLTPTVSRLEAIALRPEDIIIATCDRETTPVEVEEIRLALHDLFPANRSIVTAGVEISVQRPEEGGS